MLRPAILAPRGAASGPSALLLLASASSVFAQNTTAGFRGDALHTGVYAAADLPAYAGLRWSTRLDGPVRGSPTISGRFLYLGTTTGSLVALERATGAIHWRYPVGASVGSTPAVAGGLVLIAGADGRVHAVDAMTGRLRWATRRTQDLPFPWGHESGDLYLSSPLVVGEAVFVGNGDGALYRLDLRTGKVVWRLQTEGRVRSSPAYGDGVVFVGSADGSVYAADAATGARRWRFDTEGRGLLSQNFGYDRRTVQSSPSLDATTVYIGARDGFLYAIGRATGKERWRFDHKISWVNSSPALANGLVFAGSSDGHFEQAVDAVSGAEKWRVPTPNLVWGSAAIVGSTAYFGDATGTLYAVDAGTGVLRWKRRGSGAIYSSPVAADSTIYVGADDGSLTALAVSSGPTLDRAVFWDSTLAQQAVFTAHESVRKALEPRDYRVLDVRRLATVLRRGPDSARRTTVVFAMDVLPAESAPLLHEFLANGGRVVWLGLPPLVFPYDEKAKGRSIKAIDRGAPARLLGVAHEHANFDPLGATPTDAGRRLGLSEWLLSSWSADTAGTVVLARDSDGRAALWRKGGFVRLFNIVRGDITPEQVRSVLLATELIDLP